MKVAYGLAMADEEGPYPAAARDYQKRYRDDVGIEDPSAEAGDYVMVSYDKGKTWSQRCCIADPLAIGYTLLAATGPDSCLVISRRIQIPGESAESVAQKWRDEWPEWNDKSHVALEARQIRVGSPPEGSQEPSPGKVRTRHLFLAEPATRAALGPCDNQVERNGDRLLGSSTDSSCGTGIAGD